MVAIVTHVCHALSLWHPMGIKGYDNIADNYSYLVIICWLYQSPWQHSKSKNEFNLLLNIHSTIAN